MILKIIILTALSFLSGSIMYSYLIPKYIKHIDTTKEFFDKNPGGSNALKSCGLPIGLLCIILDVLKAFIPVYIAINIYNIYNIYLVPIVLGPVLGHAFSPFLNFKGGKAIACTFGSFLALYPKSEIAIIFALILFFFKFIITISPNSTMVSVSLITLDIFIIISSESMYIKLLTLLTSLVLLYKHKVNRDAGKVTISLFNKYLKNTFCTHLK